MRKKDWLTNGVAKYASPRTIWDPFREPKFDATDLSSQKDWLTNGVAKYASAGVASTQFSFLVSSRAETNQAVGQTRLPTVAVVDRLKNGAGVSDVMLFID